LRNIKEHQHEPTSTNMNDITCRQTFELLKKELIRFCVSIILALTELHTDASMWIRSDTPAKTI